MFRKALIALALLPLTTSLSYSADDGSFDWSGWHVGGFAGYADGDTSTTGTSNGAFDQGAAGLGHVVSVEPSGGLFGIQIGYNTVNGNWVSGVDLDVGYLNADESQFGFANAPANLVDTAIVTEYGLFGDLAYRLGYASNNFLIYGKAGIAAARIETTAGDLDNFPPPPGTFDVSDTTILDDTEFGYTIGGGIEYAISQEWSVRAEYLHFDFGDHSSLDPDGNSYSTDYELHTIKGVLSFHF